MSQEIRVRFAPSPTGYLHIGGARTALFNWLFARNRGGRFILRIEDTDRERSVAELADALGRALRWLGLDWDEGPGKEGPYGPYVQSERLPLYQEAVRRLLAEGRAYRCYCTPEELAERREAARKRGEAPRYDGRCGRLSEAERAAFEQEGRPYAVRIRVPREGETVVHDLIRGVVRFDNRTLDDFVILKSDGMAAYNFAVVVDDAGMRISHVIRAEEHLSNTPKQLIVYDALGLQPPAFAHVPMILAPDRSKLSKRHGAVAVEEFIDAGYLPEAVVNYLSLLGWSPGDERELLSLAEITERFSLERVHRTAAVYDVEKMTWMNGQYLRQVPVERLVAMWRPRLAEAGLIEEPVDERMLARLEGIVAAGRDRVRTVGDMTEAFRYFFERPKDYEAKGVRKHFRPEAAERLELLAEVLAGIAPEGFDVETVEAAARGLVERLGIKGGELIHPARLALTGRTVGPGLFDIIALLGPEECVERLQSASERIRSGSVQVRD